MTLPDDFVIDDDLVYEPMRAAGWAVDPVPWDRAGVDWAVYDLVLIRTPWDYQQRPDAFLKVLESVDSAGTPLQNALPLVRWNLDKRYLRDLEHAGVPIVPTHWGQPGLRAGEVDALFDVLGAEEIVLKPVIGANADHAYRLKRGSYAERGPAIEDSFASMPFLAQPFLTEIIDEGEFSLFYFGGTYSHAILKTPATGDFRVQEEHGGLITRAEPTEALHAAGRRAIDAVAALGHPAPLIARADLVRAGTSSHANFHLMELELIEPSLYFRMHPDACANFVHAVDAWMRAQVEG